MSERAERSFKVNNNITSSSKQGQREPQEGSVLLSLAEPLKREASDVKQPTRFKQLEAESVVGRPDENRSISINNNNNNNNNNSNNNISTTTQPHLITFKGPQNGQQHLVNCATNGKEARKQPTTNDRAPATKSSIKKDSNSLESISSKFSTSSANDDSQNFHLEANQVAVAASQPPAAVASHGRHQSIVAVRYVSPPIVAAKPPLEVSLDRQADQRPAGAEKEADKGAAAGKGKGPKRASGEAPPSANHGRKIGRNDKDDDDDDLFEVDISSPDLPPARQPLRNPKPPFPFAGVVSSVLASVFFSFSILCVKLLPDSDGVHEKAKVLFFRGFFMMILCGSTMLVSRTSFLVPRDELWVIIARATFGTIAVFGSYCSLNYISMGDSTALVFSSPIWTSILSHFLLKEPLQLLQLFTLPASLFGIVLIAHPDLIVSVDHLSLTHHHHMLSMFNTSAISITNAHSNTTSMGQVMAIMSPALTELENSTLATEAVNQQAAATVASESLELEHRWPGIVIALITSLFVSLNYIVFKFRKETPIQTTTFWFGTTMLSGSLALMCAIGFAEIPTTLIEWSLLLGNGVSSWVGQCFLQWAFFYEEAGLLSIVRTLDVAMTFILSALFLDDDIYWTSIVGATIIGLVVVSIMLNNWIRNLTCCTSNAAVSEHERQLNYGLQKQRQLSTVNDATGNVMQIDITKENQTRAGNKSAAPAGLQQNCNQFPAIRIQQQSACCNNDKRSSPYIVVGKA